MFLFEIPSTSFYSLTGARATLEELSKVRGRISGLHNGRPLLWITKHRQEISRYSLEHQRYVREKQWLIVFEIRDHGVESVLEGAATEPPRPILAKTEPPAIDPAERVKALRKELFDLVQQRGVKVETFAQRNLHVHGDGWSRNERSLAVLLDEARRCPPDDYSDLIEQSAREHAPAGS